MTPSPDARSFLTPDLMSRLDRLDVLSRKMLSGKVHGVRPGPRRGRSVEFADYRNYVTGDDLRFIDWNVYARLDRLFLKLFLEEEELTLHVLVDVSASCDYGDPNKLLYMKQVAAALGYVGLVNHHHVNIVALSESAWSETGVLRGRCLVGRMIEFIARLDPGGRSHFSNACKRFAMSDRSRGVLVVLSDFYDAMGVETGLNHLMVRRHDLFCLQCLSPQELNPPFYGDRRLWDVEDLGTFEVSVTPSLLEQYVNNLSDYCQNLRNQVIRRGGTYLLTSTSVAFDRLVLNYLRERRLLG